MLTISELIVLTNQNKRWRLSPRWAIEVGLNDFRNFTKSHPSCQTLKNSYLQKTTYIYTTYICMSSSGRRISALPYILSPHFLIILY